MASNFDYSAYFNTADKASKVGTISPSIMGGTNSGPFVGLIEGYDDRWRLAGGRFVDPTKAAFGG